jgi:hypothetical protein
MVLFLIDDQSNCEPFLKNFFESRELISYIAGITDAGLTALCEPRVFALTMLYNLNNRTFLGQGQGNTSDVSGGVCECTLIYLKSLPAINLRFWNLAVMVHDLSVRSQVPKAYSLQAED